MSAWVHTEPGVDCFCGKPTIVMVTDEKPNLLCFGHTGAEGAMFPLPLERHADWPNLSREQMAEYMKSAPMAVADEEDE